MILVLIPFWTSILVRVAAWIVLLQSRRPRQQGADRRWPDRPSARAAVQPHRRLHLDGAHPAAVHDPAAVQRDEDVPPTYLRAAVSLGSHPFAAFLRVYVPQTYPGIGAGALLVFILGIGYYITPALLGGADDQMLSYYVA